MISHTRATGTAARAFAGAAALRKGENRAWNPGKTQAGKLMITGPAAQMTQGAMGTVMTHRAFGLHAQDCLTAICREVTRLDGLLSRFSPASEISRVNASAGQRSERVSPETYHALSQAIDFSQCSTGRLDVTIAPLVTLWSTARKSLVPPDASCIKQSLPLVDYRDLVLDPWERTVGLARGGQSVDLGGIGKGFAGDKIVEIFGQFGISSAFSNLGGNVVTVGTRPDGSPWQVGIQHPRQENRLIGAVSVTGQTAVTSGDYQRCFIDHQGTRHHHILDPMTGYPAQSGLISATIISDKSLAADALSTVVFVAGLEKGLAILSGFPQAGAILVDSDLHVYVSQGLRTRFQADKGIEVTILD